MWLGECVGDSVNVLVFLVQNTIAQQIENPFSGGRTAPHIIVFAQQEAKFDDVSVG